MIWNENGPMEPNETDTHMCRNWNHRWRTSYHWWAESFDDENWVSTFLEYLEYQVE